MLRSVLSVIVGYVVVAIVVVVTTMLAAMALIPGARNAMKSGTHPPPTRAYLVANLACSVLAAVAGGYVTAVMAIVAPLQHAAALAVLFAVVSLATSRGGRPQPGQPRWYPLTILVLGVAGALAGGWLRALAVGAM
jgi:hypothetical protein